MQRLKGLTTGSLPTFIDAGSNFGSDELLEDNLLSQMTSHQLNITFMGDDTWMGLFPNAFHRSYPFPSFDVWDVDTVDRGVDRHLIEEISKPDWNLLIGHCLGVDHTGHRYGPDHPAMPVKLDEMNSFIDKIVQRMSRESLLLVMGDHGMTRSGDHGGDSPDEVTAGLFAYSPGWKVRMGNDSVVRSVSQVDLVPTLSLLMGVPIPYSNLGSVILDLILPQHLWHPSGRHGDGQEEEEHQQWMSLDYFADALHLNVKQVWRYLQTYNGGASTLPKHQFQELGTRYGRLSRLFDQLKVANCSQTCRFELKCCPSPAKLEEFIGEAQRFLVQSKTMCSSMWAQFDLDSMAIGLAIFAASLCLHYIQLVNRLAVTDVVVPLAMAASYTSNSFVVEEPYVVHYIGQTLIWLPLLLIGRQTGRKQLMILTALLSLSIRLQLSFFRCREEQFPNCRAHSLYRSLDSLSASGWIVCARISLALASSFGFFEYARRYEKIDRKIGYLLYVTWIYWIVQGLSSILDIGGTDKFIYLPKFFYFGFVFMAFHLIYQLMYDHSLSNYSIYRQKTLEIVSLMAMLAFLLVGDGLTPAVVLSMANLFLFARIHADANREMMWTLYGILSVHGFFSSGHHTSLATIPWYSFF